MTRIAVSALVLVLVGCTGDPAGSTSGSSTGGADESSGASGTSGDGSESTRGSESSDDGTSGAGPVSETDATESSSSGDGSTSTGAGETTDDTDAVTSSTTAPVSTCGDGAVDLGEQCDDGQETKLCDLDCSLVACGDAEVNGSAGEECDDGNVNEDDGCLSDCKLPACGDGMVQEGEVCDDGNLVDDDGCDADCSASWWSSVGVAYDVPVSDLKGWSLCWEYTPGSDLLSALKQCDDGQHLLVGCADLDAPDTLIMAAHGLRSEVTAPASLQSPNLVNGAQWVRNSMIFGFSPPGVDMASEGPSLLWSMNNNTFVGLSICEDYAVDGMYRRAIFMR